MSSSLDGLGFGLGFRLGFGLGLDKVGEGAPLRLHRDLVGREDIAHERHVGDRELRPELVRLDVLVLGRDGGWRLDGKLCKAATAEREREGA